MARKRKFNPGDRVWLPDGQRGTVVPTWHDSPSLCVLVDHGSPLIVQPRELRPLELLDRLAEEAARVECSYKAGERIIFPTKDGPVDAKVSLVTVHGEIVFYDGDERLIVATIKKGGRHKAVRKRAKKA